MAKKSVKLDQKATQQVPQPEQEIEQQYREFFDAIIQLGKDQGYLGEDGQMSLLFPAYLAQVTAVFTDLLTRKTKNANE